MIIETLQREVSTSGLMNVHKATIAASAKVFDFFATQTYSDGPKAIVREYASNALDAHKMAGNPDKIDVYLPDEFDPYYRVRDRGTGMSHQFATTSFMAYSDGSTKDGSNEALGGFGIGSKAGFSTTDQFVLRSVYDGVRSVYSVFKDEDGVPCIGLLEQAPTDEINGCEFAIPVEPDQFDTIRKCALEGLKYLTESVNLHGAELVAPNYVQKGETWAVRPGREASPQLIMGGIAYPIDRRRVTFDSPLLHMPIDLFLPIGAASVVLSREALLYDEKTQAALEQILMVIVDEIMADVPTMFDEMSGLWEACSALDDYLGGDVNSPRSRLVLAHSAYLGKPLGVTFKPSYHAGLFWEIEPREQGGRRKKYRYAKCPNQRWEATPTLKPSEIQVVIVDDLPNVPQSRTIKRIKTYVDEVLMNHQRVLVIRSDDLEAAGNPPDYRLTSSLPEPVRAARRQSFRTVGYQRPHVRMFQLNGDAIRDRAGTVNPRDYESPVHEIDHAYQPSSGVMVVMDSFKMPEGFWAKTWLVPATDVYFVNRGDAPKLKQFRSFDDVFHERLQATVASLPTFAQSKALRSSCLNDLIEFMLRNPVIFDDIPKSKPLAKLKQLIDDYVVEENHNLRPFVAARLPGRLDPEKLLASIEAAHGQLITLRKHCLYPSTPEDITLFKANI